MMSAGALRAMLDRPDPVLDSCASFRKQWKLRQPPPEQVAVEEIERVTGRPVRFACGVEYLRIETTTDGCERATYEAPISSLAALGEALQSCERGAFGRWLQQHARPYEPPPELVFPDEIYPVENRLDYRPARLFGWRYVNESIREASIRMTKEMESYPERLQLWRKTRAAHGAACVKWTRRRYG